MDDFVYIVNTISEDGSFAIQGVFPDKKLADILCNMLLKKDIPATVNDHKLLNSIPDLYTHSVQVTRSDGTLSPVTEIEPMVDPIQLFVSDTLLVVRGTSEEDVKERANQYYEKLS